MDYNQVAEDEKLARSLQNQYDGGFNDNVRNDSRDGNSIVRGNFQENLEETREQSFRVLAFYIFLSILELVASSIILILSKDRQCDKPLKTFILAFGLRLFATVPLHVHRYRERRNGRDPVQARQITNFVDAVAIFIFILGQIWLFDSSDCDSLIFTYSIVLISYVYLKLFLPLILLLALCVCLPCVLILLRLFSEPEGANEEQIQNLPKRTFDDGKDYPQGEAPSCTICLNDYKFGDELRSLPCSHEFHLQCVDQWLRIKKECPLCRRNVVEENNGQNEV